MELVLTLKLNEILKIFRVSFSYFEIFYMFVLRFGIFIIKFRWIDERMQSESSQGRLNYQNIAGPKSTFWWHMSVIFHKFLLFIRSKINSGTFSSSKIDRGIRIWALEKLKSSKRFWKIPIIKRLILINKTISWKKCRNGFRSLMGSHQGLLKLRAQIVLDPFLIICWLFSPPVNYYVWKLGVFFV